MTSAVSMFSTHHAMNYMTTRKETTMCTLTHDCCARCLRWTNKRGCPHAYCNKLREVRWYLSIPCAAYCRNSDMPDEIPLLIHI